MPEPAGALESRASRNSSHARAGGQALVAINCGANVILTGCDTSPSAPRLAPGREALLAVEFRSSAAAS